MNKKNKKRDIKNVFKAFSESVYIDKSNDSEFLEENGIDSNSLVKEGLTMIKILDITAKIELSQKKKKELIDLINQRLNYLSAILKKTEYDIISAFLFAKNSSPLYASNYKSNNYLDAINSLSEQELENLLNNLNKIK